MASPPQKSMRSALHGLTATDGASTAGTDGDILMANSIDKALRGLATFDESRQTLDLSRMAAGAKLDASAAQRFTHTRWKLGCPEKDPETKLFELRIKLLGLWRQVRSDKGRRQ